MICPSVEDRLSDLPSSLHHGSTVKKGGISEHAIVKKLFVTGCRRDIAKLAVIEIHLHPASPNGWTWNFSSNLKTDRFLGLDMKDQSVGADRVSFIGVKNIERRAFKKRRRKENGLSNYTSHKALVEDGKILVFQSNSEGAE